MAAVLSPDTKEQIRSANDIVEVVGSYLGPMKRAGGNWLALCPFHREKTPSFNVSPVRQIFHCFGCHKGGDVFTFVQDYENISFMEAVRRLAERARIPLEFDEDPEAGRRLHLKETLLQIHDQIARRWQTALTNEARGEVARAYLAKRGVGEEAVRSFRLGYAPDEWDDTVNWGRAKGYPVEVMEKSGLIIKREQADGHYDRFRGRLMFPICDLQGRVIGFSGRILSGDEKVAKYVNSPETPLFHKGSVIYGLDKSRRAMSEADSAIVCEGQLDLIRCFTSGVENVVAPQGTALTAEHAQILKRHVNEVVLCFDADNAGQNAAVRAMEVLLPKGLAVRVLKLPAPHDPDSFVREFGGEAFRSLAARAPEFFNFLLDQLCARNDPATDRGRKAVLDEMARLLVPSGDAVLIEKWAQRTAARLGVSTAAVMAGFKKAPRMATPADAADEPAEPIPDLAALSERERWLVRLFFGLAASDPGAIDLCDPEWVESPVVREIVQVHLDARRAGQWDGRSPLLDQLSSPAARNLVTEILATDAEMESTVERFRDVCLRLRNQHLDRRMNQLAARLNAPSLTEEELDRLVQERQALRRRKSDPL